MIPPDEVQLSCKYRLVVEIGRGGMGEVCLAVANGMAGFTKLVVLKRARPDLADEPEFLAMFLDEARLAARLNHPNVVQTYEAGQDAGRYFIAMEYLDGQPLHRIRARVEPRWFPLSMQIRILIETLAGLHHAHELTDFDGSPLGVVHRDVTPQNIFVTYDGQIKVVDFGIAKAASSTSKTRAGMIRGKVPYMAPDQARSEPLDRRVDIFAVGIMLWEAMTGERMWKGLSDTEIIRRLAMGKVPSLPAESSSSDPELTRICRRALAPVPANRYATAAELQHELERWLERQGEEVPGRVVGTFVAAHFEEERAANKSLLEHELREYCSSSTLRKVMNVERAPLENELEQTVVDSKLSSARPVVESSESAVTVTAPAEGFSLAGPVTMRSPLPAPISVDSTPTVLAGAPFSRRGPASTRALDRAPSSPIPSRQVSPYEEQEKTWQSLGSIAPITEQVSPPRLQGRRLRPTTILLAGFVAVVASFFRLLLPWIDGHPALPPGSVAGLDSFAGGDCAQAANASAPVDQVDLTVRVWPTNARIFLDGAPVSAGSHKDKLSNDGRVYRIRVEAPHFVPMEESIIASGHVIISLALERESAGTP
jgi:eukaryotic-like serine/threonine-protein kinase